MSLSPSNISSDLSHLLSLPVATLSSLLDDPSSSAPTFNSTKPTSVKEPKSIEVLNDFSPSKANPEDSQRLIKSYIREIHDSQVLEKSGEIDRLGERIDGLRERGQGLESTLSEVKV
ncbi:hypothetical protein L486_06380 [Kwoniella mangroviensis CBS 10435]|uniref:Uncharacterized protein n=1 Tax=Kwoniella mangroviensis CBS 10435 TaxID=1331196 RepID=A0A1B9ILD4_9TREE|nr:hypothetical protein L486_06380 [Kwoniella mangroviensis CBS 10435]OCF79185.1 hypothetical protein I204_01132 [Kwoniella mangroviensis CBS 8886]